MKISFNYDKIKEKIKAIYRFLFDFFTSTTRLKKALVTGGYVLLFLFSFIFALFFTLPEEEIKNRLIYEFSSRGYGRISIARLSIKFPLRLKLEDFSFSRFQGDRKVEYLKAENLWLKQSLFSLMLGRINLKFRGEIYGGELRGFYSVKEKSKEVLLKFENVRISDYTPLRSFLSSDVTGLLNGRIFLEGNIENIREMRGDAELSINGLSIGESDTASIIKIPGIRIQSIEGKIILEDGKVKSEGILLNGGDIEGRISGEIIIRYPLATSLLNLTMNIKFSDGLYEKIKNVIEPLNLNKDSAGYYTFNIGGAVIFPRLR